MKRKTVEKTVRMTASLLAGSLVLTGSLALTGCGKSGSSETAMAESEVQEAVLPEEQELKHDYTKVDDLTVEPGTYVAVVVKGLAENTYWDIIRQGVEAAVADVNAALGYEGEDAVRITFEGPAEEANEEEQINTLDTVLADNPAALCLAAIDKESCQAQLETARDNGIPVLILDAGIDSDLVTATCQTDNKAAGAAAAEKLCEALDGKGTVALITHQVTTETSILRRDGFLEKLEDYPEIYLACELQPSDEMTMEEQLLEMKEQYPDLDGIFSTNESNSDAVLLSYKDEEKLPVIVGFDNGEEQIQAILDGKEYGCICQNPYSMGYAVVIAALHAVNGEKVDQTIDSGYVWIDKTNIEDTDNQIYLYK